MWRWSVPEPRHPRPDLNRGAASGGEKSGDREAMGRMVERIMSNGTPAAEAVRQAQRSMVRVDASLRKEGRR